MRSLGSFPDDEEIEEMVYYLDNKYLISISFISTFNYIFIRLMMLMKMPVEVSTFKNL